MSVVVRGVGLFVVCCLLLPIIASIAPIGSSSAIVEPADKGQRKRSRNKEKVKDNDKNKDNDEVNDKGHG